MTVPRLRMIAGPNGSGKSTLLNYLRSDTDIPLGYILNPDEVDRALLRTGRLDLSGWGIRTDSETLASFFNDHPLAAKVTFATASVDGNVLKVGGSYIGGYFAAVLCDFIRRRSLATIQTFTFETVMSSPDKVELLREARSCGYRAYLYYVCTDSLAINRERVAVRVQQGGHDVPSEKIEARYERSLSLLPDAILNSNRAYLFDNSGKSHRLIAEFTEGKLMSVSASPPAWFVKNWLDKQPPFSGSIPGT